MGAQNCSASVNRAFYKAFYNWGPLSARPPRPRARRPARRARWHPPAARDPLPGRVGHRAGGPLGAAAGAGGHRQGSVRRDLHERVPPQYHLLYDQAARRQRPDVVDPRGGPALRPHGDRGHQRVGLRHAAHRAPRAHVHGSPRLGPQPGCRVQRCLRTLYHPDRAQSIGPGR